MVLIFLELFKIVWPCRKFKFGLRPQITLKDIHLISQSVCVGDLKFSSNSDKFYIEG
jgi:hypothetical protein